MTELEIVALLAPDIPLDDAFAQAARARALERLTRDTRAATPWRRPRLPSRVRLLALAGVLAAAALLLLTRVGGGDSAIARARAALALPQSGILIVDSLSGATTTSGVLVYHYASWQSLDHPADQRHLQTDPERGTLDDHTSLGGLVMRYDRRRATVYTQRVIVSPNAGVESEGVLTMQQRLRGLLASRQIRDLGETTRGGRRYRRLSSVSGRMTCEYLVDAVSFRPAHLDCLTAAGGGGRRIHDVVTYRIVPSTAANERLFDLRAAYPTARIEHDPNGIPGRAGHDLADITQPARYPWTITDPRLQGTSDAALRAVKRLEIVANRAVISCLARHGAWQPNGTTRDPTGTVSAICKHRGDDSLALARSPAGRELERRIGVAASAAWKCISAGTRGKPRLDSQAKRALERRCARKTRDPVAGGLEVTAG
jgi:hypothetical protein